MTTRERLTRKLEKRQEWADKRAREASERTERGRTMANAIPFGQPILVGHHSEKRDRNYRDRIAGNFAKAHEAHKISTHHKEKAQGLAAQLDRSVFSDDADAIEQLEARIAGREAKRDRIKSFNATARKGQPNYSLLTEGEKQDLLTLAKVASYSLGKGGSFPGYVLSNLGATIKRDKDRIAEIRARQQRSEAASDAGGVVIEGDEWVQVTFASKPERDVLNALKAAGFRWGGGSWTGRRENLPEGVGS